jgi:hypothetical protein
MVTELTADIGDVVAGLNPQCSIGMPKIVQPDSPEFGLFKTFVKYTLAKVGNIDDSAILIIEKPFRRFFPSFFKCLLLPVYKVAFSPHVNGFASGLPSDKYCRLPRYIG